MVRWLATGAVFSAGDGLGLALVLAMVVWVWRVKLGGLGLRREVWFLGSLFLSSLGSVFGIQVGVGSGSGIRVVLAFGIGIFLDFSYRFIAISDVGFRVLGSGQVEYVCYATL
jgi:hypothetical protein